MAIVQIHKFILKLSLRRVPAVFEEPLEVTQKTDNHGLCKRVVEEADLCTCGCCDSLLGFFVAKVNVQMPYYTVLEVLISAKDRTHLLLRTSKSLF